MVQKLNRRDTSIDIIRFLATLFVMNSHMSVCYPVLKILATGGAIGNALFFFISGFTLFLSKPQTFGVFYKKRIRRIYPSVIGVSIFACLIGTASGNFIEQLGAYWFVNAIMIYYVLLWIGRALKINLIYLIWSSFVLSIIILFIVYDAVFDDIIYGANWPRYYIYFPFMALGAYVGKNQKELKFKKKYIFYLIISIITWVILTGIPSLVRIHPLSLISLMGICYYLYLTCKAHYKVKYKPNKFLKKIIIIVGSLCLDAYLIQFYIFTDKLNWLFPLNIIIIMATVIFSAYLLNILGNLILQTFDSKSYNLKDLLKI